MPESDAPSFVHSAPRTARERVRRELTSEIKEVALAQLASGGGAALSLRAIAREMGMASSALFRYFRNRDALLTTDHRQLQLAGGGGRNRGGAGSPQVDPRPLGGDLPRRAQLG